MQDIILDNYDIAIIDGDLAIDNSDAQQIDLLLQAGPGEWKQNPMRGVGVCRYIEQQDTGQLARRIHTELSADGMRIDAITINNNNINIKGRYYE